MGPARFVLSVGNAELKAASPRRKRTETRAPQSEKAATSKSAAAQEFVILKGGQVVKKVPLTKVPYSIDLGAFKIEITKTFKNGVVAAGGLVEKGSGSNPAVEFFIIHQGNRTRDVTFAKYPGFSILKAPVSDYKFELRVSGMPVNQAGGTQEHIESHGSVHDHAEGTDHEHDHAAHGAHGAHVGAGAPQMGAPSVGDGNEIHFRVASEDAESADVILYKGGKKVLEQRGRVGDTIQTPWMGMKIRINRLTASGGDSSGSSFDGPNVEPIDLPPKSQLPPSALRMRTFDQGGGEGFWLVEGSEVTLSRENGGMSLYYGMDSVELPFSVQLESFRKMNYPGTDTAMSFESTIRTGGDPTIVKMNEPFAKDGYVLYQSSYEMGPGIPTASIFSVNKDPGRWVKYVGAIILSIGIIVFTVMRSRWYMKLEQKKS